MGGDLVVASYNLLAPCFVRPVDTRTGTVQEFAAFRWCDDAILDWQRRRGAITQILTYIRHDCDVICLQEVEFEKDGDKRIPPPWLTEALQGYEIVACKTSILERNAKRNLRVVGRDVAVASVHLDAGSEDKRVQLLGATLAAARARLGGGRNLRVIVAGDMNAEFKIGSPLGAVVSSEDGDAADALRECTVLCGNQPVS